MLRHELAGVQLGGPTIMLQAAPLSFQDPHRGRAAVARRLHLPAAGNAKKAIFTPQSITLKLRTQVHLLFALIATVAILTLVGLLLVALVLSNVGIQTHKNYSNSTVIELITTACTTHK